MLFENLSSIHEITDADMHEDLLESNMSLPAIGDYHLVSMNGWVGVSTLASPMLAKEIADRRIDGVCITGKTETENIGIEKVVSNLLALSSVVYLVICGLESVGHYSGDALVSLVRNGVDEDMRVISAKGRKCILKNVSIDEIEEFRRRVEIIDMIGCEDIDQIKLRIGELQMKENKSATIITGGIEKFIASEKDPYQVKLDKLGYFVILPFPDSGKIIVEHYGNDNILLHVIEGTSARNIYWTIIDNGWISELSHGAYLGKELTRAELSLTYGFQYIQDKA